MEPPQIHGAGIFIRDALKHFDLPQVVAAAVDRPLTVEDPVDPMKRRIDARRAQEIYEWTATVYRNPGVAERFRIQTG